MKQHLSKAIIEDCLKRGYVWSPDKTKLHTPAEAAELNLLAKKNRKHKESENKTGWIDDTRNIRNKAKYTDEFISLIKITLNLDIWPEFYFHTVRGFRIDYAIPVFNNLPVKIAIEKEGGLFMEKSGHNTGKGIQRDMEKNNLLQLEGWTLIRREPKDFEIDNCAETIRIIESVLKKFAHVC